MVRSVQASRLEGPRYFCAIAIWVIASGECFAGGAKIPVPDARAEQAKSAVMSTLKDPESAQFRNLYTKSWTGKPNPNDGVCGEVNAKNSYGGYIGFTRFYQATPGDVAVMWQGVAWKDSNFGFICD